MGTIATNNPADGQGPEFEIFPNPASAFVTIRTTTPAAQNIQVDLINFTGQTLRHETIPNGVQEINIDTGQLPAGHYLVQFKTGAFTVRQKLQIVR